jgi:peptidoglycan/LPS O-acetylase OafA/YrhL
LPGIEGLRAVAAGAIVVHHTWLSEGGDRPGADGPMGSVFENLALGVVLFFALSGFLLYRPFAATIARGTTPPDIRRYLRNRALRILPAYWVILLITAVVLRTALTRDAEGQLVSGSLSDPLQLLKAALLIHDYDPATIVVGIGPAWSLAVEVVFYLLLPLLVLGAARAARRAGTRSRRVAVLLAPPLLLLLVGLSGKFVAGVVLPASPAAGYSTDWHSVVERSFWAQADLFSFGMAAAVLHTEVVDGRLILPRGWRLGALTLVVAIALPCAVTLNGGQLSYLVQNTAVALAAALLLAVASFPSGSARVPWLQRLLEVRFVVAAGLVSYSVFLWHEPLIRWLADRGLMGDGWGGLARNLVLVALVVAVLSILTYRLVELPALRRKRTQARAIDVAQLEAAP